MSLDHRSGDALISVCQDNQARSITISDMNQPAQQVTGYAPSELMGRPLAEVVPPRIAELLTEYVEFEPDADNDVGAVLARVPSFSLLDKEGKEKIYRLKVARIQSSGGQLFFSLVLHDTLDIRREEAVRSVIQDNFKGHETINHATGLPDKASLMRDVALAQGYGSTGDVRSAFGVLQIDRYDDLLAQHGREFAMKLVKHVATVMRQSMRPHDVLGSLSDEHLGVLLVDIIPNSERLVFNRLRWQVAVNPYNGTGVDGQKITLGLSVSICFCRNRPGAGEREVVEKCETSLNTQGATMHNTLLEVRV